MTIKRNNYNLTNDSGLIPSVISSHINKKITRQPVLPESDPGAPFFCNEGAPEMRLLKYVSDDFYSFQKLKQAFNVWSSLPEESRQYILNAFLKTGQVACAGKPQEDKVYSFCRFFLAELIPVLSACDN